MNHPAATPSDSSYLQYLPKITTTQESLIPLDKALKTKEPYVPIAVLDFAPGDRRQQYRCVASLSTFSPALLSPSLFLPSFFMNADHAVITLSSN